MADPRRPVNVPEQPSATFLPLDGKEKVRPYWQADPPASTTELSRAEIEKHGQVWQ